MEKNRECNQGGYIHDTFTEKWFSEEMSLVTGLFHLEYDRAWRCTFAAEECFRVLRCGEEDFFDTFKALYAFKTYRKPPVTVAEVLEEIAETEQPCSFISISFLEGGMEQYVKCTLTVFKAASGVLHVYGQVTDVSEEQQRDVSSQDMAEQGAIKQQIFQIAEQHTNRAIYIYDIVNGITQPWNEESKEDDILAHLYTDAYEHDDVDENEYVMPDSKEAVKKFFAEIHSGRPSGEAKIHVKLVDGQIRWYHFKFSDIFVDGKPATALISIKDVTERHDREMAYQRYRQTIGDDEDGYFIYIESDLTEGRIEKLAGQFIPEEERQVDCRHADFGPMMLELMYRYDDAEGAGKYFSQENLLAQYENKEKFLRSEWKTYFNDGTVHWLDTMVVLVEDPYNSHVKALISMFDVTERQEKHLSVLKRADFDGMTGLLRKAAGEERIKEHINAGSEKGGILLVIDLDDLKGINDILGHKAGDEAIIGIAKTLKGHFRNSDVIVRAGGDEFIAFLPDAGLSVDSVKLSVARLLQKLSQITVGENRDRNIHCSVGGAVELPGTDTYDTMFSRADIALYHVKRSGKNNYAFYLPEMATDDFKFKTNQPVRIIDEKGADFGLKHLLKTLTNHYQGIIRFNLSKNQYSLISFAGDAAIPQNGGIGELWEMWKPYIHTDDVEEMFKALSRKALLSQYAKGVSQFVHRYRNTGSWGEVPVAVSVDFFRNDDGDVCVFLFFRNEAETGRELELMQLKKMLEMTMDPDIEYVCIIDIRNKMYSVHSRDDINSHQIPEIAEFDLATRHIRDTQIPEQEREAYYEKAQLDNVVKIMQDSEEPYSYRYNLIDGQMREATFSWYENTHLELMMTVRRLD